MTGNVYEKLYQRFAGDTGRVFLDDPGRQPLSYWDLDQLSGRYAAALGALGVVAGERVVAQVEKTPDAVALYLACLRLGAVYVPLNTAYTAAEMAFFLRDCEPRLLLVAAGRRGELESAARQANVPAPMCLTNSADSLARRAAACEPDPHIVSRTDNDLAVIIYTSGTTGRAKGAMLTVGNLISNGLALHETWGWRDDDVLLHALPVFHVHGLFVALHCAMLNGSPVLFLPRFDVAAVRTALPRATVMMGVPTFYTRLLAEPDFSTRECRHMRLFISGSAPLSPQIFAEFEARTGHRILERYGMSEAGIIASNPLHGERLAGSVGFALPDVEVRVADSDGHIAAVDHVGELEVRGPNLFAGYWRLPDKTAAEFRSDGFFMTGDLGQMSAEGRISIVGRGRDLIISGGYNIYPREIERCLDELPEISESAVVGVPDADFGEAVVAVIVPTESGVFDQLAVERALQAGLARFKHPRRFFLTDALPRNAMGKVQKNELRERYGSVLLES